MASRLDELVRYYESLTAQSVARMGDFYAADAYFKDPFNEVRTLPDIQAIFARMFEVVESPRFVITERIVGEQSVALTWDFDFGMRGRAIRVHGASVLRFDAAGRVQYHRDYWDAAEELYEKLPVLGVLMRWLKRRAG
ncbi:MAG TPA: nuclear transport factor 2 family protein [Burkholderiales bacterium]|nr:nuclear transport factor 2 family protein [Betaproteobacteria bacterium]HQR53093.1 nuclear transport factor 2 family protein [Burkholderiales bacterium]